MEFRQRDHVAPKPEPSFAPPATHHPKKRLSVGNMPKQLILWLIVLILLIAAAGTAAYYVKRYHDSQKQVQKLSNPTEAAKTETQNLIDKVGKLTVLPAGETPTIATVTDASKLKDQAFFVNAVTGDKVLIYTNAKKAFLYRPSTNKLINIAPVNLGTGTSTTTQTTTPTTTTTKK
jgi:cell division protein FtsL